MKPDPQRSRDRRRRYRAARKYRPDSVDLLLVAEGPPRETSRYFYFENVWEHDSLFRYVVRELLGKNPSREGKKDLLAELQRRGTFLIDLSLDPVGATDLRVHVPSLVRRCRRLSPKKIILIKTSVYDAAYGRLRNAGLPVVDERIPFPGSGQQRRFEVAFRRAVRLRSQGTSN